MKKYETRGNWSIEIINKITTMMQLFLESERSRSFPLTLKTNLSLYRTLHYFCVRFFTHQSFLVNDQFTTGPDKIGTVLRPLAPSPSFFCITFPPTGSTCVSIWESQEKCLQDKTVPNSWDPKTASKTRRFQVRNSAWSKYGILSHIIEQLSRRTLHHYYEMGQIRVPMTTNGPTM